MTNSADPDQKPTDLDLHCLLRQGMSCSAREGLRKYFLDIVQQTAYLVCNPIMAEFYVFPFTCTKVGRVSDSVKLPT